MTDKRNPSQIHVAFDTNFAFVKDAEDRLITQKLGQLIVERSKIRRPQVSWYLLDIVRRERRYQMLQVALKLVPSAERVSNLLGENLGISQERLERGVDAAIQKQITEHALKTRDLDTNSVDWHSLIHKATNREPPFKKGEHEKGFRDAIVLETFDQLVREFSSPSNYFVLVSDDGLLTKAFEERMQSRNDVKIIEDFQTLESMLNAYTSDVDADQLKQILETAQRLFYNKANNEGLFFKWKIEAAIREQPALFQVPVEMVTGAFPQVQSSVSLVGPTTFVERDGQTYTLATHVDFAVLAKITVFGASPVLYPGVMATPEPFRSSTTTLSDVNFSNLPPGRSPMGVTGALSENFIQGIVTLPSASALDVSTGALYAGGFDPYFTYRRGRKRFEVKWSAIVHETDKLTDPQLLKVEFQSEDWS
jgi:hypothetical protein